MLRTCHACTRPIFVYSDIGNYGPAMYMYYIKVNRPSFTPLMYSLHN